MSTKLTKEELLELQEPPMMEEFESQTLPERERPKNVPTFEEGDIIPDIIFSQRQRTDGTTRYLNSDPLTGRKMIELRSNPFDLELGTLDVCEVSIEEDTDLHNPDMGKYWVELVSVNGQTIEEMQQEKDQQIPTAIAEDKAGGRMFVLTTTLPVNKERKPGVPEASKFAHFTLDDRTLEVLETVSRAIKRREPCLLEGETAASKTSSIEYLAMRTNNAVLRLNLNGQSDTTELIGKYVPNDGRLAHEFMQSLKTPELLTESSRSILENANLEARALSIIESQRIAQNEGMAIPEWKWEDGLVVRAVRDGYWLILDEMNLAQPQVLERLNSLTERDPSLTVVEHDGMTFGSGKEDHRVHQDFRIFATMNPAEYAGRQRLSPAYKDRWTASLIVQTPNEAQYQDMLTLLVSGKQPDVEVEGIIYRGEQGRALYPRLSECTWSKEFVKDLARFHSALEDLTRTRAIGKGRREPYIFTRRGLLAFLDFLENEEIVERGDNRSMNTYDAITGPEKLIKRAFEYCYENKVATSEDRRGIADLWKASVRPLVKTV